MRTKTGVVRRHSHKKILKSTKGYRLSRNHLIKTAKDAFLHAGQYAFNGRRKKKGAFRNIWTLRLNAALRQNGINYSKFIHLLDTKNIKLNRKVLSTIAFEDSNIFAEIVNNIVNIKTKKNE